MKNLIFILVIVTAFSCAHKKQPADMIVHNAVVYTVDSAFTVAESFAVKDGKILAAGSNKDILDLYETTHKIDAQGKAVYPGFIDAHCHFYNLGRNAQRAKLKGSKSFEEVLEKVVAFSKENKSEWILGRGWDQNLWTEKKFPNRKKLDELFPDRPVVLTRVDGHALLANGAALKRAGVTAASKVSGGAVEVINGKTTGILIDNAMELVTGIIPAPTDADVTYALATAQKICFAEGLTTVDDAGLSKQVVLVIDSLQKKGELKMRVYAMLSANMENFIHFLRMGPTKTERLNICSFKFFADGALGSRGAYLLKEYSDSVHHYGLLTCNPDSLLLMAKKLDKKGFQMNTHCIGDAGSRVVMGVYATVLGGKNDKRWRIEHAQVISKKDFEKFSEFSILPSVQPTHATSDMKWAIKRLGPERIKGAYAYKDLLQQYGLVALGTDFPVEEVSPMLTFYAAVARKDLEGYPEGGFEMENALSREETLKGMTIWAAYSNFEEKEKGSIEKGKVADFIILDKDIMKADINEVPKTKVISTYVNGENVYSAQ